MGLYYVHYAIQCIAIASPWGFLGDDHTWQRICVKLDLSEYLKSTVPYISFGTYLDEIISEEQKTILENNRTLNDDAHTLPFSDVERDILQDWFEFNESAFTLFEESLQHPTFYIPPVLLALVRQENEEIWEETSEVELIEISGLYLIADCFCKRCHYHLSLGNTEKAWLDVQRLYRILKMHSPNTFRALAADGFMREIANRTSESVLHYGNWSCMEIRQKLEEVIAAQHPLTDTDVQRIIRGERLRLLDHCQRFSKLSDIYLPRSLVPVGQIMVATNRTFDEYANDKPIENYPNTNNREFIKSKDLFESENTIDIFRIFGWYGLRGAIAEGIGRDREHLNLIISHVYAQMVDSELTRLVFALELYRKEHEDRYPPDLATLCNGYIEKIPIDPFSQVGNSVIYKANTDFTGYLLYSVGINGVDDGGLNEKDNENNDDIRRKWHYEK